MNLISPQFFRQILLLSLLILSGCFNNRVDEYLQLCMSMQKPVKIDFLYKIFQNGELLPQADGLHQIHYFSPHPHYEEVHGTKIFAVANHNGDVVRLECSQGNLAF